MPGLTFISGDERQTDDADKPITLSNVSVML